MGKWGSQGTPTPRIAPEALIARGPLDPLRDKYFSKNGDTHNLMCQVGHGYFHKEIADEMFNLAVTPNGSLYRRVPHREDEWGPDPSLDMLAAACYFYVVAGCKNKKMLSRLASHHWKNCFNLENKDGNMSGRCENSGMQLIKGNAFPKGKKILGITIPFGITKPTVGQAYLTTAALLSLAAYELGGKWKWRYRFWRLIQFGWFWEKYPWLPLVYKGENYVWSYVGHVCQMALFVIHKTGHDMTKGLRWCAVDNAPRGQLQPFMAGMAAECGALSHDEKEQALMWLCSRSESWPQHFPSRGYNHWNADGPEGKELWSMMAHCAAQLTGVVK